MWKIQAAASERMRDDAPDEFNDIVDEVIDNLKMGIVEVFEIKDLIEEKCQEFLEACE